MVNTLQYITLQYNTLHYTLEDKSTNNEFSSKIKNILQEREVVDYSDVHKNWEQIRRANSVATTILRKKN